MGICDHRSTVCHGLSDDCPRLLRRLGEMRIFKVSIACRGRVSPASEQLASQGQSLAQHYGVARRRTPKVMQARSSEVGIIVDRATVHDDVVG